MTPENRTAPRHASQGQSITVGTGSAVSGSDVSTEATAIDGGMAFSPPRPSNAGTDTPRSPEAILTALLNLVWKDVTERLDRIEERQDKLEATLKIVRVNTNPRDTHAAVLTTPKFKAEKVYPSKPDLNAVLDHVPAGAPRLVENSYPSIRCPACNGTIFKGEVCAMSRNVNTGEPRSFHRKCFNDRFGNVGVA